MNKSEIVIIVNVGYCIVYLIVWLIRYKQNYVQVQASIKSQSTNVSTSNEWLAYSVIGSMIVLVIAITIARNYYIFDNWFPISFLIQFFVQFIILVLFVVPDNRITREVLSALVLLFYTFALWNGLFRKDPKYTKLDITRNEVQQLTHDIDAFNIDLDGRLTKVKEDMNSSLKAIQDQQKDLDALNALLKRKEDEYSKVKQVLELDKDKADEVLRVLNVHPPTLLDRILDWFIGAFVGVIVTIFAKRTALSRWL